MAEEQKVEDRGTTEGSAVTSAETVGEASSSSTEVTAATRDINMPEGCRCGLKWRIPEDSEGYTWNYQTVCPVKPEDHGPAFWRPFFKGIIASGSGGGQAPGGARLIINDGKWRHPPRFR
ncbi:hypothetical protein HIM_12072 [Hirsutella minnesotensis 3608]|uniref:Uncharacterized protein n=1 Tax=Hirsutella minnesotensis 3608 TaxID=1043627 RepID=A0A0F7ZQV7_9HYPO|nr:hypothetical protein HIM_12072 [Hirsutella minnesotensis 3608]